jgi:hypothetical protein
MSARAAASRVALAAVVAAALACRKTTPKPEAPPEPPVPALGQISVEEAGGGRDRPAGVELDLHALEGRARETLVRAGVFAPGGADGGVRPTARVRVQVVLEEVAVEEKAAARAVLRVRVDVRPNEAASKRWHEDVEAGAEVPYRIADKPDRRALFQKLVGRALDDLLGAYVSRLQLWSGDPKAVAGVLHTDAGVELRVEAIHAVAERKLGGAVPTLLALLDDPDEVVRDAALGALVELRERRAVSVLAQERSMRDRREMRKILDAIALLGGDEAADYLSFVADGHEDPEIRALAADARKRLLRHGDAGR